VLAEIGGRLRCTARAHVRRRRDADTLADAELPRDVLRVHRAEDVHGDVEALRDDVERAIGDDQLDLDLGIPREVFGHDVREEHLREEERRPDAKEPARKGVRGGHRGLRLVEILDDARDAREVGGAGRREAKAACRSFEEANAELGLEARDPLAHRGLRHSEALRSLGEAALASNAREHYDIIEICHGSIVRFSEQTIRIYRTVQDAGHGIRPWTMSTAVMNRTTPRAPDAASAKALSREPAPSDDDHEIETEAKLAGGEPPKKKPKAKLVFAGLALSLAAVGTGVWLTGRGKESTDDAFVEGHVATVAARIQGQVIKVNVRDNQLVQVGDVLVEIDDRDAKVRLTTSEADLLSAKATLSAAETQLALTEKNADANLRQAKGGVVSASAMAGSSKASIDQAKADVEAAESRRHLAELDLERAQRLRADDAIPQADLDMRKAGYDQAVAAVAQARARETNAVVGITNAAGSIETAQGRLVAAQAGPEQIEAARAAVVVASARVA